MSIKKDSARFEKFLRFVTNVAEHVLHRVFPFHVGFQTFFACQSLSTVLATERSFARCCVGAFLVLRKVLEDVSAHIASKKEISNNFHQTSYTPNIPILFRIEMKVHVDNQH